MDENLDITIEIEGLDSQENHVLLGDFLEELKNLQASMMRVDRLIDGTPSVDFRIVDATHSSPLTITLEPIRRTTKKHIPTRARLVKFHHRFFQEMAALAKGQAPSEEMDDTTLGLLDKVAKGYGKNFKSLRLKNHVTEVKIDSSFQKTVHTLLTNQIVSYGTLTGDLDALNVHGEQANMIWIYPSSGPERVACRVPSRFKSLISKSAQKTVKVTGRKHYRPGGIHPHFVDVEDVVIIPPLEAEFHIGQLRGAFKGHMTAEEIANFESDEWD
ncbi:hypothetical protein [Prosthecobacter sp.]|uniref:hypothetical protein n=1 Tax=Prosthecobacter sp. TaxID=1965333 RepID=UPI0037838B1E